MKKLLILLIFFILSVFGFLQLSFPLNQISEYYPTQDIQGITWSRHPPDHWVRLDQLSQETKWCFLVSEDWAFYQHAGVDFEQLKIVFVESLEKEQLTRGASTITQQLVKNLFLSPEKTFKRKLLEIYLSWKVERIISKDRILETYLNVIEFGEGLYGIGKASEFYFQKHPIFLTVKEAAFLAMLLPNPKRYSQSFRDKQLTDFAKAQLEEISIKLRQAKIISEEQRVEYFNQELKF